MSEKFRICIISPAQYTHAQCFTELAFLLRASMRSLGHDCDIAVNLPDIDRTNILLGSHLLKFDSGLDRFRYIPYQLEQLGGNPTADHPDYRRLLASAQTVWDFSPENIEVLAGWGVSSTLVPIGFHEDLCRIPHDREKRCDVLFYGSIGERRRKILNDLLAARIGTVQIRYGQYGPERDALIAASRLILNIHNYEQQIFEAVRVSWLLNNRCFVISEQSASFPWNEVPLVQCRVEDLHEVITGALGNPGWIEENRKSCFDAFREFYPMTGFVRDALSARE